MVEPGEHGGDRVAEREKIDHHAVSVGRALHVDAHRPVVAMHGFTEFVGERDEVAGGEDVDGLAEPDFVVFGHGCGDGAGQGGVSNSRNGRRRPLRNRI